MGIKKMLVEEGTMKDIYSAAEDVAAASKRNELKCLSVELKKRVMMLASQVIRMKHENEDH